MLLPNQPKFLSPLGFKLSIDKIPTVTFFTQVCPIPDLEMGYIDVATPMHDYPTPGDELTYGDLVLEFIVDENLKNYKELLNWMIGLGHPESLDQFKSFSSSEETRLFGNDRMATQQHLTSDGVLSILTNNSNVNLELSFIDLFPVGLSSMVFGTTAEDIKYITCTATFKYSYFKFR